MEIILAAAFGGTIHSLSLVSLIAISVRRLWKGCSMTLMISKGIATAKDVAMATAQFGTMLPILIIVILIRSSCTMDTIPLIPMDHLLYCNNAIFY